MTTATPMTHSQVNSTASTPSAQPLLTDQIIGNKIRSITAEQIASISEKISSKLYQTIPVENNSFAAIGFAEDPNEKMPALISQLSKTNFTRRAEMLFFRDMTNDFQFGATSELLQDKPGASHSNFYTYSWNRVLDFVMLTKNYGFRHPLVNQPGPDYQIHLGLDWANTQAQSKLVFAITERNQTGVLSTLSFTL